MKKIILILIIIGLAAFVYAVPPQGPFTPGTIVDWSSVTITGGTIDGTPIGGSVPDTGSFTSLTRGDVSDAEFLRLNGVTSAIQTQLDARALESIVGTSLGAGMLLDGAVLKTDVELQAIAGLTSAADKGIQFTGSGTAGLYALTAFAKTILDDANESTFKATVNLEIGTDVLAYDAGLSNLAGIAMVGDRYYYTSADNTHVAGTITSFGRSIIDDANESTFKATVNLEIGTDVLAYDAGLSNLAGIAMVADRFYYTSGDNTHVAGTITSFGRSILDDANEATFKATVNLEAGTDYYSKTAEDTWRNSVTQTEMGYLNGIGSDIQTQLDARALESIVGTSIGGGIILDTGVLKTSLTLQSLDGLTFTNGDIIYATGAATLAVLDSGTSGYHLRANGVAAPTWEAVSAGGASVALDNLSGVAINESLVSDTANMDDLGTEAIYWRKLYLASEISFEGSTDNDFQTTITFTDPTTPDKTITFPDLTGTVALSTNKLDFFASTSSAELAGIITGATGSVALVFANTPTLVTPELGAATATTIAIAGNTTYGERYINVSTGGMMEINIGTAAGDDFKINTDFIYSGDTQTMSLGIANPYSGNDLTLGRARNGMVNLLIENGTSGTAAGTMIQFSSSGGEGYLRNLSAGFTTSGNLIADSFVLEAAANLSSGLVLAAKHATTGTIAMYSNDALTLTLDDGKLKGSGTAPGLGSCGTSPTITGSDINGKITIGTGATTSCTVTFATTYTAAPACVISGDNNGIGYAATTTATILTITSSVDMASDVISYICMGIL